MIEDWLVTTWQEAGLVVVSTILIFVAVVVVVRLNGLRSFSKMSSFDFAVTVAVGSLIAGVALSSTSLVDGVIALVMIIGSQRIVARARSETRIERFIDNKPTLLMLEGRMLDDKLEATRVTPADVRAKLREANVFSLDSVRAVVLETTGDISVLHGDPRASLDPELLEGVVGAELLTDP